MSGKNTTVNKHYADTAQSDITSDSTPAIIEKFVIRLPQGLREQIKEVSEHNRRSMNAEIVRVLEKYINEQKTVAHENPDDFQVDSETDSREDELSRRLESLPADKKNALLSLLA